MARLLNGRFVPVRFTMLWEGPGADALGRELVQQTALAGRPSAWPPDLLAFDPARQLRGRLDWKADAASTLAFLQGLLPEPEPGLAVGPASAELALAIARSDEATLESWPAGDDGAFAALALAARCWATGRHARARALWAAISEVDSPLRHRARYNLYESWPTQLLPEREGPGPEEPALCPDPAAQARALQELSADPRVLEPLPGFYFRRVPAGAFTMGGQPAWLPRELPLRRVTLSRDLWVQATPLSRGQLHELWPGRLPPPRPDQRWLPAIGLSWTEAGRCAELLSARAGLRARLPTEAEWEWAARGGLEGQPYPWGEAGIDDSRCNSSLPRPCLVASYPPNGWGLHDMVGNCQEWTADLFLDQAYALTPAELVDPLGPSPEQCPLPQRAVRGGLCGAPMTAIMNRVAFRVGAFEQYQGPTIGLRLVVETDG